METEPILEETIVSSSTENLTMIVPKSTMLEETDPIALEKASSLAESSLSKAKKFIRQKVQNTSRIIEQPHVVILFLLLVYVEIILESLALSGIIFSPTVNRIHKMIINLQCIELGLQLILFPLRYFSHWGYCFDTALVSAKVFNGQYFNIERRHLHIASFFRVWRFVQVVQSFIVIESSNHARTKDKLLNAEQEKRLAMEEIDTLREALQLAAVDVAAMKLKD